MTTKADSVGQRIARKLLEWGFVRDGIHPKDLGDSIDAELARERDAWVSVVERLPEKEILVLISTNEGGVFTGKYREYNGKCFWLPTGNATYAANWKVTHWRPLPAPPACGS